MTAANYDFTLEQGATSTKTFVWKDEFGTARNLTGYTARMHVRPKVNSAVISLDMTTENGRILITPLTGKVVLVFSAETTAAIAWRRGKYDLELVSNDGTVTRLMQGEITVSKEVTRD